MTVPTVADVLNRCAIRGFASGGSPLLDWNGCMIPFDDLRAALEDAYDPAMPDWPAMVQVDA